MNTLKSHLKANQKGYFGEFGGIFVPEVLVPAVDEVDAAFKKYINDPEFNAELQYYFKHYIGRPSPLYFAKNLSHKLGGAKIYFKRDELNHTGAHKINNCIGQALLAKRLGKKYIIAETGAGQHGVATATVCALFGMQCKVFMGAEDVRRQSANVFRMRLLGAEVVEVNHGSATLCDAMNEALRYWSSRADDTYYLIGTSAGPRPYPEMVMHFQSIIGTEARQQILEAEGRLPTHLVASIGGGSNSIGLFAPFLQDDGVKMIAVEAGGTGLASGENSASLNLGSKAVFHGNLSYYLQDEWGQISKSHSIAAGLDYPGVSPVHSYLKDLGRVKYEIIFDKEAMLAIKELSLTEGIIPAIEPAHSIAYCLKVAGELSGQDIIIANLCGRGDKDINTIINYFSQDNIE